MSTKQTILTVDGMTCASCVRHVEGALRALDGIAGVAVELRGGEVRVEHDPAKATSERMIQALREAGYASRRSES